MEKIKIPYFRKSYGVVSADNLSNIYAFELNFYGALSEYIPDLKEFVDIYWTEGFMQIKDKKTPFKGKPIKSVKKNTELAIDQSLIDLLKNFVEQQKNKTIKEKEKMDSISYMKSKLAPVSIHLKSIYKLSSCVISSDLTTITIRLHEGTEYLTPFAAIHIKSDGSISEPNLDGGCVRVTTTSEALKFIEDTKDNFDLLIKLANEAKNILPEEFLNKK